MKTKHLITLSVLSTFILLFVFGCSDKPEEEKTQEAIYSESEDSKYEYESYDSRGAILYDLHASANAIKSAEEYQPNETDLKFTDVNEVAIQKLKKIIKAGRIRLKSQAIEQSKSRIDSLTKIYKVVVDKEEFSNSESSLEYRMTLRIESDQYDQLLIALKSTGDELKFQTSSVTDVSEDFFDLELRRKNERAFLETYNDLLRQARTMKEVLKVQETIQALTEEIESKSEQIRRLDDLSAHSTIHIVLYEEKIMSAQSAEAPGFISRLGTSVKIGWQSIIDGFLWVITKWPTIIIAIIMYFILRKIFKIVRQRRSQHS